MCYSHNPLEKTPLKKVGVPAVQCVLMTAFVMVGLLVTVSYACYRVHAVVPDIDSNANNSYTDHDSVLITSNAEFVIQGWTGDGSETNPYVLEWLRISSTGDCIRIYDTTMYFIIRHCIMTSSGTSANGSGVLLQNVTNGQVASCEIASKSYGIIAGMMDNCALFNNTILSSENGIAVDFSTDCLIENNVVDNDSLGVTITDSTYCILKNNSLGWIVLQWTSHCELLDNRLGPRGIENRGGGGLAGWLHETDGNTVNGRPLGYFVDLMGQTIDASLYAQIVIVRSSHLDVINGNFTGLYAGIQIAYSSFVSVSYIQACGNLWSGAQIVQSNSCTLSHCVFSENSGPGVSLQSTLDCTVVDCALDRNVDNGIIVRDSHNCTLVRNSFLENGHAGINVEYSSTCAISNNTAGDNTGCGIQIYTAQKCNLTANTLFNNEIGISLEESMECMISYNEISDNGYGVFLDASANSTIANNTIYENHYGIYVTEGSLGNLMYLNCLIGQSVVNALDNGAYNLWDDGPGRGNIWDDFNGTGMYEIPGSAGSVDRFPRLANGSLATWIIVLLIAGSAVAITFVLYRKGWKLSHIRQAYRF